MTKDGLDLRFELRVELAAPDIRPPKLTCKPKKKKISGLIIQITTCYDSPSKENQL